MTDATYPCYRQQKDSNGEWYWIYYAKNGKAIARSSESYKNRTDCAHSIELMKDSASDPVVDVD